MRFSRLTSLVIDRADAPTTATDARRADAPTTAADARRADAPTTATDARRAAAPPAIADARRAEIIDKLAREQAMPAYDLANDRLLRTRLVRFRRSRGRGGTHKAN